MLCMSVCLSVCMYVYVCMYNIYIYDYMISIRIINIICLKAWVKKMCRSRRQPKQRSWGFNEKTHPKNKDFLRVD